MDHRFVPNLTFGPPVVAAVERVTTAFIDAHLMVEHPEAMVREFRDAGADQITIHLEACANPGAALATVRASGARAGLAIKPATPLDAAAPWLDAIDALLVMSVEPGFGGQRFIPAALDKLRDARERRASAGLRFLIGVDGGIAPDTAAARARGRRRRADRGQRGVRPGASGRRARRTARLRGGLTPAQLLVSRLLPSAMRRMVCSRAFGAALRASAHCRARSGAPFTRDRTCSRTSASASRASSRT
jgi:ribulose-phosphate 3-epimerase